MAIKIQGTTIIDDSRNIINANEINVSGVSTFQGNVNLGDNDKLRFGDDQDLQIYHNGTHSYVSETGTGSLRIVGDIVSIRNNTEDMAVFNTDGAVELYYDNDKKFETTGGGIDVTGIVTATSFSGSGANLTGLPAGYSDLDAALFN